MGFFLYYGLFGGLQVYIIVIKMKPVIKYVKKASRWCKTYWIPNKDKPIQKQAWFDTKEEAEEHVVEEKT